MVLFALALALLTAPRLGTTRYLTPDSGGFPSQYPRALARDGDDLWVGLGATGSPEGLARVHLAAPEAAVERFVHLAPAAPDARPDEVHALAVTGGVLWVATERGLFRAERGAPVGAASVTFEAVLAGVPIHGLALAPDGAPWATVAAGDGWTAAPVAALASRAERPTCWRPRELVARAASLAWLVCEDGILELGARAGFAVDLVGTPLRLEPMRGDVMLRPIDIQDVAATDDGAMYFLSQRGGLVRGRDGQFTTVADDGRERRMREERQHGMALPAHDFVELLAEPGGRVLVSDVRGVVQRWTGEALVQVWPLVWTMGFDHAAGSRRATPIAATAEARWIHLEPEGGVGAIVRLDDRRGVTMWPLRRPGTTYADPAVLAALPDDVGGLWISTNDGLWYLAP